MTEKVTNFDKLTGRDVYFQQMEQEIRALIDPATHEPYADMVEWIDCPTCGGQGKPFLKKWGFSYQRCPGCKLLFVNPRLREDKVIELYRRGSKANEMWATTVHSSIAQKGVNRKYFNEQLELLARFKPKGKLLDVGCGNGDFLDSAVERGYESVGCEIEENAVEIARGKGLKIESVPLAEYTAGAGQYDVVTMFGILEHFYDPKRDVTAAARLLKKDGVFFGITPNAYSLVGMILNEDARFYTPRNHSVIYSSDSLTALLDRCGLEVVHMDTVLSGYDAIVNRMQYRGPTEDLDFSDIPPKLRKLVSKREDFEKLLWEYDLGLRLRVVARRKTT